MLAHEPLQAKVLQQGVELVLGLRGNGWLGGRPIGPLNGFAPKVSQHLLEAVGVIVQEDLPLTIHLVLCFPAAVEL